MKKLNIHGYSLRIISVLFFCLFESCVNKQKELEYLICRDSVQYWDYDYESNDEAGFQNSTFRFDNKNAIIRYNHTMLEGIDKRYKYSLKFRWMVNEDSILTFMSSSEKIYKISKNQDTIFAYRLSNGEKVKYTRVKGSLNIKD